MDGKNQKAEQILLKDGISKEAGNRDSERQTSCDVWKFWRQKSPMMPETPAPAPGTRQELRRCTGNDMPGNVENTSDVTYSANLEV